MKKLLSLSINGKKILQRILLFKPESEKSGWEKIKDGLKSVAEWCKENWKSIAKIVAAAVVITGLGIAAALTGGILGVILAGAFWEHWPED